MINANVIAGAMVLLMMIMAGIFTILASLTLAISQFPEGLIGLALIPFGIFLVASAIGIYQDSDYVRDRRFYKGK